MVDKSWLLIENLMVLGGMKMRCLGCMSEIDLYADTCEFCGYAMSELVFDEWPIQHVVNAVTGQTNQWAKVEK